MNEGSNKFLLEHMKKALAQLQLRYSLTCIKASVFGRPEDYREVNELRQALERTAEKLALVEIKAYLQTGVEECDCIHDVVAQGCRNPAEITGIPKVDEALKAFNLKAITEPELLTKAVSNLPLRTFRQITNKLLTPMN